MKPSASPRRPRLQARIEPEIYERLHAYLARTGKTEGVYLEGLIRQDLDNTRELTLLRRHVDGLAKTVAGIAVALELFTEVFGLFFRMWLARTTPPHASLRKEVQESAEEQFASVMRRAKTFVNEGVRTFDPKR